MVSEMAIADCEELLAKGLKLTCRDIVRLNALGVKSEKGRSSVSFYALPRCCFVGDVCFREPTIGHEVWYDDVSREFEVDDNVTEFFLNAFMLSRDADDLPSSANIPEVKLQLDKFVKQIKKLTVRQVMHAVAYCTQGCDADEWELPEVAKKDEDEDRAADESLALGVVREGQALGLGISLADAKKMTRSQLQGVIFRAYDLRDLHISKSIRQECIGDYYATLQSIKDRLEKEKENG